MLKDIYFDRSILELLIKIKKKVDILMQQIFIKTDKQHAYLKKIEALLPYFKEREPQLDKKGSFPFQNIKDLKDIGYHTISLPKAFGGEEISLYDFLLFQEKIAEGDGSTALSIGWHVSAFMRLTENRPWPADVFAYVCKEVKNGALLNRALTERNTGSPTRGGKPETMAKKTDGGWVVTGRKTFTSMAPALDYFVVTSSIDGEDDIIGEFLIPREAEGVSIDETWDSVSLRGTASHDLVLENVAIPQEYLVEKRKVGAKKEGGNGSILHIPACYLGIAQAARNEAVKFAANYQPNSLDKPIATLPNIQHMIGKMELALTQARHLLYSVAEKYDQKHNRKLLQADLAAVKYTVTNNAVSVVDLAMRIVGARSLSEKNPLHRYYLNVRAGLHNPPMDDSTLVTLANRALQEAND